MKKSPINFSKYVATGNDFITLDNRELNFDADFLTKLAQKMCKRKFSVGADGLLVLENSSQDIRMKIFNPDGSEVKMCGNGLRCIALFARDLGLCDDMLSIETLAGVMEAEIKGDKVRTQFQEPTDIELNFNLNLPEGKNMECNYVNTGVPHVVIFVKGVDKMEVISIGRIIRYHEKFKPEGTNVNFVEMSGNKNLKIRTYERGVEDETLACGTGAVASAVIGNFLDLVQSPIDLKTKSGHILTVSFQRQNSAIKDVWIEGKVEKIFKGRYENV